MPYPITRTVRAKRRTQAEARTAAWRALTPAQQIAALDAAGHRAKRQRERIALHQERA